MLAWHIMQLREQYLKNEPMTNRTETYATIAKAIKTLDDPYTRLFEPSRYQALKRGNQGSVIGVGVEVGVSETSDSQLVVGNAPCKLKLFSILSYSQPCLICQASCMFTTALS